MSTITTLILIASGIAFDPAMGSELMMTTKNCLVRSGADISYYEIAVLPEGAIVRTFPEQNLGQFIAVKMVGGELGTFKNITCDIELINTTSEAFDQKAMTYTARKGDKAALRQIGVEPGKSVSRYRGALLTSGQVYKVLSVSVESERAIQRTILEIAMPESSYAFVLQSNLVEAPEEAVERSKNPVFQAQTSEETIVEFRKKEEERRQAEAEEERRLAEQKAQKDREEEERRLALEEEQRQKEEAERLAQIEEEKRIAEQKAQKEREQEERRLAQEEERRKLEEQAADQPDVDDSAMDPVPLTEGEPDATQEESGLTDETKVWDGVPVTLPEAWSTLESAWKSMVQGPVLEAEPEPLRREFESLANQTDNEIISSQAKRLLEAIDLFKLIQVEEQKFIELQARLGQLESDVAARQKLALSRTDLDFVGILSISKAYDGKPGANGRPRPLLLRLRDPVSQRTVVYLNPKGPLSEQLWQLSRNQALIGISGSRGPNLLGVPQLQAVGTLEVLGSE
ncbi:MAG: hypothetical protein CMJ37_01370 [Phycisphaerae bacterium]|nr:hypothetical protein [Phycisphaerae bacterium]